MEVGVLDIPSVLGFQVFPEEISVKRITVPYVLDKPLYWSLPKDQLGDKVLSYNGFLSFNVESRGSSHFPDKLLQRYPLIILQGNQRIVLVHSHG
ncbi:Basement membrane-specific heparan sulfate proteoglycan core protein, partial [Stegodyphus mimosarum]